MKRLGGPHLAHGSPVCHRFAIARCRPTMPVESIS